ncbi:MAG: hypothetical protein H6Q69_974 [Firmicutes bacterium]|nr:hypothetical protein [Bacillota bacterium]
MDVDKQFLLKLIKKYRAGRIDRLDILQAVLAMAGLDEYAIGDEIKEIFADATKFQRGVGKPRKVDIDEILIARISGNTYDEIAAKLDISASTVYRTIRANKIRIAELEHDIKN